MKVSVCVPSHNLDRFVGEAIQSVLSQTFTDFELLIEDDGSSDNSVAVINGFTDPRIKFVARAENIGANATTNSMVRRAQGEYIALLAADDAWEPEKLAKQVAVLDAQPEVSLVMCWPEFIDESGAPCAAGVHEPLRRIGNGPMWRQRLLIGNAFFGSQPLYRRSVHEAEGYFDEPLVQLSDLDMWLKCLRHGELHVIQEPLAHIRVREGQMSERSDANLMRHSEEILVIRERHRKQPTKFKLAIATPFYESRGWAPYIHSIAASIAYLAKQTKVEFDFWEVSGDAYIWRARNGLAHRLLESDFTHLMFIDSDMGWNLEAFQRVVAADLDIVGAAYPVKNNWEHYGVRVQSDKAGYPLTDDKWGTVRATDVPTGFMKINRTVFDRIRKNEPDNWYWSPASNGVERMHNYFGHLLEDHVIYGEDISFCRRAVRAGCEIHVETRANMMHMGVQAWTGNYYDFLCKQPGGSASDAPIRPENRIAA